MYTLLIKELWNAERWMEANFAAVKYITRNSNHSKDESFDINLYNACITGGREKGKNTHLYFSKNEWNHHYFSSMDYCFLKTCNFKKHKHTPVTKHTLNREHVMRCIVKPTDLDLIIWRHPEKRLWIESRSWGLLMAHFNK